MIYSAWGRDGEADTLVPGDVLPESLREADPGLSLICYFEAEDWDGAMEQYFAWQGWEPYVPDPKPPAAWRGRVGAA